MMNTMYSSYDLLEEDYYHTKPHFTYERVGKEIGEEIGLSKETGQKKENILILLMCVEFSRQLFLTRLCKA